MFLSLEGDSGAIGFTIGFTHWFSVLIVGSVTCVLVLLLLLLLMLVALALLLASLATRGGEEGFLKLFISFCLFLDGS